MAGARPGAAGHRGAARLSPGARPRPAGRSATTPPSWSRIRSTSATPPTAANMQVWCLHNPVRYAFVATEGPVIVFDFHGSAHLSAHLDLVDEVRPGRGWYFFKSGRARGRARRDLGGRDRGSDPGRMAAAIAGWRSTTPIARASRRSRRGASACTTGRRSWSWRGRSISADEIKAMRCALATCESDDARHAGASGARRHRAGALGASAHAGTSRAAASRLRPGCLASGQRTNPWFQECSSRAMRGGRPRGLRYRSDRPLRLLRRHLAHLALRRPTGPARRRRTLHRSGAAADCPQPGADPRPRRQLS